MKKEDITYQDKINELRLDISHPNSTGLPFILVEGETDIRLFRKFFNLNNCKVENVPGGKSKLEEGVAEILNIYELVIGIRDADFVHLGTIPYTKPNMFLTDYHDSEMGLIFEDEVFRTIVFEFTDIPRENHNATRDNILQTIEDLSLLKWLNDIESLEIKFDATGFRDIISFVTFTIDFKQYFSRLLSKSPNAKIKDVEIIIEKLNLLKATNPNHFQLCNGHDFIQTFSQFLRNRGNVNSVSDDIISSVFRINYNKDLFLKTNLYKSTKQWADNKNCNIYL